MSEWQPIETLPPLEPALLRIGPMIVSGIRRQYHSKGFTDMMNRGVNWKPTHWLPLSDLPDFPKDATE